MQNVFQVSIALFLLSGCAATPSPTFQVRNEFDGMINRNYGIVGSVGYSNEISPLTRNLLLERFPNEVPVLSLMGYFSGLGGSCSYKGSDRRSIVCEYCREKVDVTRSYFSDMYVLNEFLWRIFAEISVDLGAEESSPYYVTAKPFIYGDDTRQETGYFNRYQKGIGDCP